MIDASPDQIETVKGIIAKYVPECEVRAFGSRVNWTAKDYSDLDLVVVGKYMLDVDTILLMKEAFEYSDLPFRVDVLDGGGQVLQSYQGPTQTDVAWAQSADVRAAPAGTRAVTVQLHCSKYAGTSCDAFFDDMSVVCSYP